jgi:alpha-N-arabinofuranosidase
VSTALAGLKWNKVTGQILTSANLTDINTFQQPNKVSIAGFNGAKKAGDKLVVDMPAKSVVTLELN